MQVFAFLEGISPWWWLSFAVVLGAVEMATMSFFLIWPALAAVIIAIWLTVLPGLSGEGQIAAFALLSILLTFLGRTLMTRFGDGAVENPTLNSRSNQMIDRHGKVVSFTGPEGDITIDGIRWRARWVDGSRSKPNDTVLVTGAEGMTLFVKPS